MFVIGGGDTGNDCIGTSVRMGAKSVNNFELLPQPPESRSKSNPWPQFARIARTDYGHAEVTDKFGKDPRTYSITTDSFEKDADGNLAALLTSRVQWTQDKNGAWKMAKVPGSQERWPCQACFLALGFLSPEEQAFASVGVDKDARGNIKADDNKGKKPYATNIDKVFACGDARRGQSLIVWGIQEGRACAAAIDEELTHGTRLPQAGGIPVRSWTKFAKADKPLQKATVSAA